MFCALGVLLGEDEELVLPRLGEARSDRDLLRLGALLVGHDAGAKRGDDRAGGPAGRRTHRSRSAP